ncbi:MAG: tyrosine protein kinase, partial [Streptococcaceae bacterium]|nr:tyrosine protein kinase [Streptococcaceae bacterium]
MNETINLREVFEILRKHLVVILVTTFVGLAAAGVMTFFVITPQYSSRAQLVTDIKGSENGAANAGDLSYNLQMLNTYKDIIKQSDAFAKKVQSRLLSEYKTDLSIGAIKGALGVGQSENSQMFSISATYPDPAIAEHIANAAADSFQDTIKDVWSSVNKVSVTSRAVASTAPSSPNNKLNLLIGTAVGLLVGIALALLLQLLDRTVKEPRFV